MGPAAAMAMQQFVLAIQNAMTQSTAATQQGVTQMNTATQSGMTQMNATATAAMVAFVAAIRSGGSQATAACRSTAAQMVSAFAGLYGSMFSAGSQAMNGLRAGIASAGASAIAQARNIANQVASTVNSALKIHSPSKVLMQSGQFAGMGLAEGLKNETGLVQNSASKYLAQPIAAQASQSAVLETPTFDQNASSSVIPDTVNRMSGGGTGTQKQQSTGGETFVFSPTYRFEGGTPSKEDMVQANKMSQEDFKKMMREYLRTEGRRAFT